MLMICSKCGKEISVDTAKHCLYCGNDYCEECGRTMCDCAGELRYYN